MQNVTLHFFFSFWQRYDEGKGITRGLGTACLRKKKMKKKGGERKGKEPCDDENEEADKFKG